MRELEILRAMLVRKIETLAAEGLPFVMTDMQKAIFVGKAGVLYETLEMIDDILESESIKNKKE